MRNAVIWVVLCALAVLMVSNYLTGAIFLAFKPSGSDFSELYAGSWLWRQNQNPYDPALATSARQRTVGSSAEIFLINFPTSLVLVAPFTALPWAWANLFFLLLGLIGLAATIFSVLRLRGHPSWTIGTVSLAVFVLAFSPLRIAFQWGNIVVLVLPLSVLTIVFAEHKQDWLAGVLLALACCLKPQIGICLAFTMWRAAASELCFHRSAWPLLSRHYSSYIRFRTTIWSNRIRRTCNIGLLPEDSTASLKDPCHSVCSAPKASSIA